MENTPNCEVFGANMTVDTNSAGTLENASCHVTEACHVTNSCHVTSSIE